MRERCKPPPWATGCRLRVPMRIRFRGRVLVDKEGLSVTGGSFVDLFLRLSVLTVHLFDSHLHELLSILVIGAGDFCIYYCSRIGPGFTFRIKNAWQPLLHA